MNLFGAGGTKDRMNIADEHTGANVGGRRRLCSPASRVSDMKPHNPQHDDGSDPCHGSNDYCRLAAAAPFSDESGGEVTLSTPNQLASANAGTASCLQSDAVGPARLRSSLGHMNTLRTFSRFALLCIACAFFQPASGATPTVQEERDRQVLETLLLRLLSDAKFDMTGVSPTGATIILHTRTPEKTGFLMSTQIRSELGSRTLPSDAENDLRRRNTPPDTKPDTYDSLAAFYTNLTFAAGIEVTNLTETWEQRRPFRSFEDTHPKARDWLEAYLPGYSKDGTRAVVRAGVGPWAHAAMLTAVLEKRDGKWVVAWYHVARFV
jgi:hypothetical protein